MTISIPHDALVLLVGPVATGKTTWAATHLDRFTLSSDVMRAIVGEGEHDQRASKDAFAVLDDVIARRLRRGLLTVVDSLGLDPNQRERHRAIAAKHHRRCVAVVFEPDAELCRSRNRARARIVPPSVLTTQLEQWPETISAVLAEPFDAVHVLTPTGLSAAGAGAVRVVPAAWGDVAPFVRRQQEDPLRMKFGLQIPRFAFEGGPGELAHNLAETARRAEEVGFSSLWVMDHFLQIPQTGREWEDMLDSYTTLSFLAAHTRTVSLGAMVTGITYRNVAHLSKIVATLDVLSGGRALCGLGAAWFEREHELYDFDFPPRKERYERLEDALQLLPLMWGPGSPRFEGRHTTVTEAICYPRPLQEHVPILVGGQGEKKTLRLVARYADACNLFGDPANVAHKVAVLHAHCADVGRDPDEIEITHLGSATITGDTHDLAPQEVQRANAGTVDDHIGRYRAYAEAGLQHAIVNVPTLTRADDLDAFAPLIDAFR